VIQITININIVKKKKKPASSSKAKKSTSTSKSGGGGGGKKGAAEEEEEEGDEEEGEWSGSLLFGEELAGYLGRVDGVEEDGSARRWETEVERFES